VLRNPAFVRLLAVQLASRLGEGIALVAMPLLVYGLTGSAELLSLVFVLQLLPRVVFAPVAGMLADRLDRRRVMIAADVARALLAASLVFADQAWQVAVVATLIALGSTIAYPAEMAALPMVVPPSQLVHALSVTQVAGSAIRVVGPTLAAGIVATTGPSPAFGVQAACFLTSAAIAYGLRLPRVERTPASATGTAAAVRQEIADGLRLVWQNPIVRGTAVVEALWQLVTAVLVVALLVYVEQSLRLGERSGTVFSLLTATVAGGMAVGSLVARAVERRIGRPRLMAIGYLAPLLLISAALTPPLPVLFVVLFIFGFTDAWAVIAMQTYLAESVPDAMRGRAYAGWLGVVTLAGAIGFAIVGWATPRLGPSATLALVGLIVGIGGPVLLVVSGALRAIRGGVVPVEGRSR
jgi:MFS transporter, NRE family, putaive nickel resistance protein